MSENSAPIIPFPGGLLARRETPGDTLGHPLAEKRATLGANALPTPSCDGVKARRLAKLLSAAQRVARRAEFRAAVQAIQDCATRDQRQPREMEQLTGLSRRTFARIVGGEVDIDAWLPKLRTAAARLNQVGRVAPRAPEKEAP